MFHLSGGSHFCVFSSLFTWNCLHILVFSPCGRWLFGCHGSTAKDMSAVNGLVSRAIPSFPTGLGLIAPVCSSPHLKQPLCPALAHLLAQSWLWVREMGRRKAAWEVVGFIVVQRVPLRIGQSIGSCRYVRVNSITYSGCICPPHPSTLACKCATIFSLTVVTLPNPHLLWPWPLLFALTLFLSHFSGSLEGHFAAQHLKTILISDVWYLQFHLMFYCITLAALFLKWWNRFNRLKASLLLISHATSDFFFLKGAKHTEIIFSLIFNWHSRLAKLRR